MVMGTPTIEVDPKQELQKLLGEYAKKAGDLTIPLQLIAQQWFRSNEAIFALAGPGKYPPFKNPGPDGKSIYQKQKIKRHGFDYPLLFASGRLGQSITSPTDSEAVNYIINKFALVVGTKVPYAIYHQSKDPRSKMPYRPMILFGNEQIAPGALNNRIEGWRKLIFNYVANVNRLKNRV